jgi:hypothetical protein
LSENITHAAIARGRTAIPRTAAEATNRGYGQAIGFRLDGFLNGFDNVLGTHFTRDNARKNSIAWIGPCEDGGTRVVCYYDASMQPTDCRNIPCVDDQ